METFDAIRSRRNVRSYAWGGFDHADLEAILEAGRRSPSSMNQQAWDFVVVTEPDSLRDLAKVWKYAAHVATSSATVALVTPGSADPDERETYQFDLGQVAMSMMLAASDRGIGSCHSAIGEQDLAREVLGLPADRECMWLLAFGRPADDPLAPIEHPGRRAFDDVVHRERW